MTDGIFLAGRWKRLLQKCPEIKFVILLSPSRLLIARCVGDPQLSQSRREQNVVQVRFHGHRSVHQANGPLDRELLVLVQDSLRNTAEVLVAIALRQQHRMRNRRWQFRMRLAGTNHGKPVGATIEPHGRVAFGVGNDVVILAGSLAGLENLNGVVQRTGFFEDPAYKERHRRTGPLALTAAAHLADRDLLVVHSRDRADETGKRDVHKRDPPVRLCDDQHRVFLQFPVNAVVEHSAVQQRSLLRDLAEQSKAAAMKKLGDRIRREHGLRVDVQRVGESLHFFDVAFGDIGSLHRKNRGNCLLDRQPGRPGTRSSFPSACRRTNNVNSDLQSSLRSVPCW